jgi:DNA-binding SARP family transcriptional activator/tetratricopeptide (TPR) repeat protein
MSLSILGPLRGVPVLPAGQRAVLGLLALAAGEPVHRAAIIDLLWRDAPPASAAGIVHTYVSRLRSALGPRIVRDGSSYRLVGDLDLLDFRVLVQRARDAGDPETVCDTYEHALGLWRGEPLADIDALRGHPAIVALADERLKTVLDFADVAADSGRPARALPQLRGLAARCPLDEALHARLLIALAGTGRQGEALDTYEGLRQRLDDELGVQPGPVLRAAHTRVLRQEIPAAPSNLGIVFQLPAAPADFTGRTAQCQDIVTAIAGLDDHPGVPAVAISGPPGVGKTALTLFAAHSVRSQFPGGQLWVQLAGASSRPRDIGEVLGELLRTLGVPGAAIPGETAERAKLYRSRLAGRKVLVVADDAASAAQAHWLLPGTAGCGLIVTSRLRLEGLDGAHLVPLDVMSAPDCVALVSRVIGQDRVASDPEAAVELVRVCGALPLAMRIAAAKLAARPAWPVSAMVRKLTGEHDRLRELQAGDLSVRASIASSFSCLGDRARRAFGLLALHGPSDFAGWVAGALLGEPSASDVVDELVTRSLLTPLHIDATGEPRYRLHDLIRDYAGECLADEPAAVRTAAFARLQEAWIQLAERADSRLPPEPYFPQFAGPLPDEIVPAEQAARLTADPIAWFTTERVNLLAAVERACSLGSADLARWLAARQGAYHYLQDRHDDAEAIWRAIADSAGPAVGVYARLRVAASLIERGHAAEAEPLLERCLTSAEQLNELETLALALYWRSASEFDSDDDFEASRGYAERGIAVARLAQSRLAELMNLRMLCTCLSVSPDGAAAVAIGEHAMAIAAELGGIMYELVTRSTFVFVCTRAGEHHRAVQIGIPLAELHREHGSSRGEAIALGMVGDSYYALGEYQMAVDCLRRALPLFESHQADRYYALCLFKLGRAHEAMADYPEAIAYFERSAQMFDQLLLAGRADQALVLLERCRRAASADVRTN